MEKSLVLSIFPGIDLLGRAFEEEGYCIVRGPDVLWGGDVRSFNPPAGVFEGVIGGDPCQAHIPMANVNRARGREPRYPDMTPEFCRVVELAQPVWWLRENVPQAPDPTVHGYVVHRLRLNNRWLGEEQNRERIFWFGTQDGRRLMVEVALFEHPNFEYAVASGTNGVVGAGMKFDRGGLNRPTRTLEARMAARNRSWQRRCELQGLPADFLEHAPFTQEGRRRALANGVPLPMGRAIAKAVKRATGGE